MNGPILGCDPGRQRDPTGVAVLAGFDILHLARLPLATSYVQAADHVATLGADCAVVAVDVTGVGRALVDLLVEKGLGPKVLAVTLTGGAKVRLRGDGPREASVPRRALFLPLQGAVEAGRLRVAEGCPYRAELAQELLAARDGASGVESCTRDAHGDLMTGIALALWAQGLAAAMRAAA